MKTENAYCMQTNEAGGYLMEGRGEFDHPVEIQMQWGNNKEMKVPSQ